MPDRGKSSGESNGREDSRVELSHFVYGNARRCLPDGRKEMQSPGEIENVKKQIHARARKML